MDEALIHLIPKFLTILIVHSLQISIMPRCKLQQTNEMLYPAA